jgi:transcriptional regulator with XRE-family HTH domain
VGYVSQIEAGKRPLERRSTQVAIAKALNISVAQLIGSPTDREDPLLDRAVAHVPAVRQVLVEVAADALGRPTRDRETLANAAREVTHLRSIADYASMAPLLPGLLRDLRGHGVSMAPQLIEVVDGGVYALKALGFHDLAHSLITMALPIAQEYDVPAWIGQARYTWVQSLGPESSELGTRVAQAAADDLQGSTDSDTRQMYGHLHLMAAMSAAVSTRAVDAWAHLAEAEALAGELGEPERIGPVAAGFNGNWFGPANVAFWRLAVAAELNDLGQAQQVQRRVDPSAMPVPGRWVYFWTDLARALAGHGRDQEALHALARAERAAPQHFRFNPAVRDLVATLLVRARRRAVAGELTQLARTLGLDPL